MRNCSSNNFRLPSGASSIPAAVRASRSVSVKMPVFSAGAGKMPSLTPSTSKALMSGRRLRSISPTSRLSAVGGMSPMELSSSPADKMRAKVSSDMGASPRISTAFCSTSMRICQICRCSSALAALPLVAAASESAVSFSAMPKVSRWTTRAVTQSCKGRFFFRFSARRGAKGVMTCARRSLRYACSASCPG